jgi:hypothetical protein
MSVVDWALIGKLNRRMDFTNAPSWASPLLSRTDALLILRRMPAADTSQPGGHSRGLRGSGGRSGSYMHFHFTANYMNIACYAFRFLRPSMTKRSFKYF